MTAHSAVKNKLDGFALGVGGFGVGGERIEAEKFRVVMQKGEIRIAASPDGILEAGFPGFLDGF
jgi:hypothetical protein